jgi:hypothetical protein
MEQEFQCLVNPITVLVFVHICTSTILRNGDACQPGSWVLAALGSDQKLFLCQVVEILQCNGSVNHPRSAPDSIPAQNARHHGMADSYEMPQISIHTDYLLMDPKV